MPKNPQKQYPKNQIYSFQVKPAIETKPINSNNNMATSSYKIINSSKNNHTKSPQQSQQSNHNDQRKSPSNNNHQDSYTAYDIKQLHNRIQFLHEQLEQVMTLMNEDDSQSISSQRQGSAQLSSSKLQNTIFQVKRLQEQMSEMAENLSRSQQLNTMLQKQLKMSQNSNNQLRRSFQNINQELEQLKLSINNNNKNSQQQQQIETILQKFHNLNIEYSSLQEQNEELRSKIHQAGESSVQRAKIERYQQQIAMNKQQIVYLKEQINKLSQISIINQRQTIQKYQMQLSSIRNSGDMKSKQDSQHHQQIMYLQSKVSHLEQKMAHQQEKYRESLNEMMNQHKKQIRELKTNFSNETQTKIADLQYIISDMQRNKRHQEQQHSILQSQKDQLARQLVLMKNTLDNIQVEVSRVIKIKDNYARQIQYLKKQLQQLENEEQSKSERIRKMQEIQSNSHNEEVQMKERQRKNREKQKERMKQMQREIQKLKKYKAERYSIQNELKQQISQLKNNLEQLNEKLETQKHSKDQQNKKYRELIQEYKVINEEITTQIQSLRTKERDRSSSWDNLPEKNNTEHSMYHPQYCHIHSHHSHSHHNHNHHNSLSPSLNGNQTYLRMHSHNLEKQNTKLKADLQSTQTIIRQFQKEIYQLRLASFEIKSKAAPKKPQQNEVESINQYRIMIKTLQNTINQMGIQYHQMKSKLQMQYYNKLEIQRKQIIEEFKFMLGNRNQPGYQQYKYNSELNNNIKQQNRRQTPKNSYIDVENYNQIPIEKLKYHPEFKKLSNQIVALNRKIMESQYDFNRTINQRDDQIANLKIQNKYHRANIDRIYTGESPNFKADSQKRSANNYQKDNKLHYGNNTQARHTFNKNNSSLYFNIHNQSALYAPKDRQIQKWREQYNQISKNYKELYREFMNLKEQISSPTSKPFSISSSFFMTNPNDYQNQIYRQQSEQQDNLKVNKHADRIYPGHSNKGSFNLPQFEQKEEVVSLQLSGHLHNQMGTYHATTFKQIHDKQNISHNAQQEKDIFIHQAEIMKEKRNKLIGSIKDQLRSIKEEQRQ